MTDKDSGKPPADSVEPSEPDASDETPEPDPQSRREEPATFPRSYVEELRDEASRHRVRAKRAEDLAALVVTAWAAETGKLADATDLPVSDDLMDEDGMPDRAKVVAAVDELVTRKPHLRSTRPAGNVGQGARSETTAPISLAAMLRAGAG